MAQSTEILFSRGQEVSSGDEDAWDDTELIRAYDRSVALAKDEIRRRMGEEAGASGGVSSSEAQTQRKSSKQQENKKTRSHKKPQAAESSSTVEFTNGDRWTVGMPCRAAYHEDGIMYEAVIESLSLENGVGLIRFLGYDNQQVTCIEDLIPTEGKWAQKQQIRDAQQAPKGQAEPADAMEWANTTESQTSPKTTIKKEPSTPERPDLSTGEQLPFSMLPPPPPLSQFSARLPAEESEALSSMLMSWYLNGFHTGYYLGLKKGKEQGEKK